MVLPGAAPAGTVRVTGRSTSECARTVTLCTGEGEPGAEVLGLLGADGEVERSVGVVEGVVGVHLEGELHVAVVPQRDRVVHHRARLRGIGQRRPRARLAGGRAGRRQRPALHDRGGERRRSLGLDGRSGGTAQRGDGHEEGGDRGEHPAAGGAGGAAANGGPEGSWVGSGEWVGAGGENGPAGWSARGGPATPRGCH